MKMYIQEAWMMRNWKKKYRFSILGFPLIT